MRRKGMKRLAAFLALSLILAGIAPAMQAEAASLYKKFPTYTRYENKYGKAGMTADNGALENLLAAKTYRYIYLRNVKTAEKYTIPANSKFAGKRLRVNTPLSKVVNHASSMKVVKITEVESWTEYGKGNSFAVVDENAKFEVGTGSNVDKLYFQADNGKVDLDVKGDVKKTGFYGDKMDAEVTISQGTTGEFRVAAEDSKVDVTVEKTAEVNTVKVVKDADVTLNVNDGVEKVVVDAPANVTITGDSEKVKEVAVEVGGKAEGAKVTSDVPVKAEVEAKADITLKEGAEGSTVKKADEKVEVAVKNDTKKDVTVSTEGTTKTETVPSTNKDTTGGGTTGGGSTGGGTIGGGSSSGSTGGDYYPPTGGGGDTPNPPSPPEPTVTPSAIEATVSVSGSSVGSAVTATGGNGTYSATIETMLPAELKVVLGTINVASIKAITVDGSSVPTGTTISIPNITTAKDITVVITEENGATNTLTITVKALVENAPKEIEPSTYETVFAEDNGAEIAYAAYIDAKTNISTTTATLSPSSIEGVSITNGGILVKITTAAAIGQSVTLVAKSEQVLKYNEVTVSSITFKFTSPTTEEFMTKKAGKLTDATVVKYTPHINSTEEAAGWSTYAAYKPNGNVNLLSGTAIRQETATSGGINASGLICISQTKAYNDTNAPFVEEAYVVRDGVLKVWWKQGSVGTGDTSVTGHDPIYHDLMLNLKGADATSRVYYVKEVVDSTPTWYKIEIKNATTIPTQSE